MIERCTRITRHSYQAQIWATRDLGSDGWRDSRQQQDFTPSVLRSSAMPATPHTAPPLPPRTQSHDALRRPLSRCGDTPGVRPTSTADRKNRTVSATCRHRCRCAPLRTESVRKQPRAAVEPPVRRVSHRTAAPFPLRRLLRTLGARFRACRIEANCAFAGGSGINLSFVRVAIRPKPRTSNFSGFVQTPLTELIASQAISDVWPEALGAQRESER